MLKCWWTTIDVRKRYFVTVITPLVLLTIGVCTFQWELLPPWYVRVPIALGFALLGFLLYLPELIIQWLKLDSVHKPATIYACGVLLIVLGCFVSHRVPIWILRINNAAHYGFDQVVLESFGAFVLVLAAVTGGTLCADAILGIEAGESPVSIGLAGCTVGAVVYCLSSEFFVWLLDGDWRAGGVIVGIVVTGILPLAAWWRCKVGERHEHKGDRTIGLVVCGLLMILLAAILGIGAQTAVGGKDAGDFIKDLMPAFSAAVGACLVARGVETNYIPFDFENWIKHNLGQLFTGAKIEFDEEEVTLFFSAVEGGRPKIVTITPRFAVLAALRMADTARRNEIGVLTRKWLERQTAFTTKAKPSGPADRNEPQHYHYPLSPKTLGLKTQNHAATRRQSRK